MYSAYKLIKHGDNIQPWCTPFPIWNQSVVPCPVLTVASWPAYRFLEVVQVVWYAHLFQNFPQFLVIHTVKGFGIVNKAEIDVFLGEGNGNSCLYFCLENPRDRGAWWAAVYGVTQSRKRLKRLSSDSRCFSETLFLFWSSRCWQFDLWFLCLI